MKAPTVATIEKLVVAGEQAGFTVEEMIELLQRGLSVASLLKPVATCELASMLERRRN